MNLDFPNIYDPGEAEAPKLLCQVRKPCRYQILSLHFCRDLQSELERIGVFPGGHLEVLSNDNQGTLAVRVRNRMVILGRQLTYHTRVLSVPRGRIVRFPG